MSSDMWSSFISKKQRVNDYETYIKKRTAELIEEMSKEPYEEKEHKLISLLVRKGALK